MDIRNINFKKYKDKATELLKDKGKIQELLKSAGEKIQSVLDSNEQLRGFVDQINTMIRMIKAQFTGEYKDFPWKSVVMITGALIYFITPIDLIPDIIPALGFTDDAALVYWVYKNIQEDVEKFKTWEASRQSAQ